MMLEPRAGCRLSLTAFPPARQPGIRISSVKQAVPMSPD